MSKFSLELVTRVHVCPIAHHPKILEIFHLASNSNKDRQNEFISFLSFCIFNLQCTLLTIIGHPDLNKVYPFTLNSTIAIINTTKTTAEEMTQTHSEHEIFQY